MARVRTRWDSVVAPSLYSRALDSPRLEVRCASETAIRLGKESAPAQPQAPHPSHRNQACRTPTAPRRAPRAQPPQTHPPRTQPQWAQPLRASGPAPRPARPRRPPPLRAGRPRPQRSRQTARSSPPPASGRRTPRSLERTATRPLPGHSPPAMALGPPQQAPLWRAPLWRAPQRPAPQRPAPQRALPPWRPRRLRPRGAARRTHLRRAGSGGPRTSWRRPRLRWPGSLAPRPRTTPSAARPWAAGPQRLRPEGQAREDGHGAPKGSEGASSTTWIELPRETPKTKIPPELARPPLCQCARPYPCDMLGQSQKTQNPLTRSTHSLDTDAAARPKVMLWADGVWADGAKSGTPQPAHRKTPPTNHSAHGCARNMNLN